MKETAQGLAALGRGPDTQLVHMTPGEVKSLQQLAMANGGSLTINPATGLPEAGFLSSLLPMLIGAGITAATGGAAAPWMVGLGVGGVQAARTGSIGKGLMAGLGAYGGAGLGGALAGAGATSVSQAAGKLAGPVGSGEFGLAANQAVAAQNPLQLASEGAKGLLTEPGRASFMQNIGGGMGLAKTGAMAAAPILADQMVPTATQTPVAQNQGMIRPYTYTRDKIPGAFQDVAGAPYSSKERPYFTDQFTAGTPYKAPGPEYMAEGGGVSGAELESAADTHNIQNGIAVPYMDQAQFAGGGGISDLGDYSDGGRLLRGPGDGVSDSIPAMIGKKQQARLADGEFVIPARIVSELGNGSTEAGARQLYAMMDRVQKNRKKTMGKGKVAVNSKSHKMLPA